MVIANASHRWPGGHGGSGSGKEGWDSRPVLKVESIGLAQDLDYGGGSADEKR